MSPQEELSTLKEGEVRERTPARPPQRSFGPRRFGQALFGQRAGGQDGPLLPQVPPRSYGKVPPPPSGPPGSPGGAGSVTPQVHHQAECFCLRHSYMLGIVTFDIDQYSETVYMA